MGVEAREQLSSIVAGLNESDRAALTVNDYLALSRLLPTACERVDWLIVQVTNLQNRDEQAASDLVNAIDSDLCPEYQELLREAVVAYTVEVAPAEPPIAQDPEADSRWQARLSVEADIRGLLAGGSPTPAQLPELLRLMQVAKAAEMGASGAQPATASDLEGLFGGTPDVHLFFEVLALHGPDSNREAYISVAMIPTRLTRDTDGLQWRLRFARGASLAELYNVFAGMLPRDLIAESRILIALDGVPDESWWQATRASIWRFVSPESGGWLLYVPSAAVFREASASAWRLETITTMWARRGPALELGRSLRSSDLGLVRTRFLQLTQLLVDGAGRGPRDLSELQIEQQRGASDDVVPMLLPR